MVVRCATGCSDSRSGPRSCRGRCDTRADAGPRLRPGRQGFSGFLHPETHEEYALARTERKTAPGYKGFVFHTDPSVTLEEDLVRRDLTINAMALDENGSLIDPYGGQRDIAARVLRHVSNAFAEDPVRILRLARFAARFEGFSVAPETMALMSSMVDAGEVDALVAERVWQELAKGLMERRPSRMLRILAHCGALARLLPGLPVEGPTLERLDAAASVDKPLTVRWAILVGGAGMLEDKARALSERVKAPGDCRDLAILLARERSALSSAASAGAAAVLALLERCDALRRPGRFAELLEAAGMMGMSVMSRLRACRRRWRRSGRSMPVPLRGRQAIADRFRHACRRPALRRWRIRGARLKLEKCCLGHVERAKCRW